MAKMVEVHAQVSRTFQPAPYKSINIQLGITRHIEDDDNAVLVWYDNAVKALDTKIEQQYKAIAERRKNW